ncbi:MAG: hypothetical protein CO129_11970 [Ignavibacteriales bacterium CG_4_9_14_3_um_filter_34_10]|nr:MAG: hypothetical protein CO129_11970 [Ignavibacteriales bacterium CG_4_9_14_3_um_filter_34_10]
MKRIFIIILLSIGLTFSSNLQAAVDDVCGTTSGSSAPYLPTSGTIKVFVIFAQFKDDPQIDSNGWAKNSYPSWANTFVNSSSGGSYPWNNLSHYFNEMSNGTYQVIGDVYNSLVTTDYDESYYSSIGQVNREIILEVDPYVNFAEYDNLNGNVTGSDGIVDFIYIIYRNATSSNWYYTGIAHLEVSSTINVDGKQIVNNSYIGGGVQQRGGYNGRDYTLYVAAHEMGHYLLGGGHISNVSNLALMTGLPVWNASRGMHSWERQKLGWINYTNKSTDGSVTMSDYLTADQVYRVPISSTEYFLIENRKKISPHDKAGDTGFYFYRITSASSFPPTIDVLCADGNWNFSINTSTQTLTRTTPNVNGNDEMNFRQTSGGVVYACYTSVYHENSAWGDDEDAFDLTFNNVLSPVSNPRSNNGGSLDFTIEVTGTNTIQFYFTNPYAGKPSKPQNLQLSKDANEHTVLTWNANQESDLNGYRVYKKITLYGGSTNTSYVFTTSTSYTDTDFTIDTKFGTDQAEYWIVAVDNTNKLSVESEHRNTSGESSIQWKLAEDNVDNGIINNYELYQNYPNPFNPTTQISYQIKESGLVQLIIYNTIGQKVATLVNEVKSEGRYTVNFNAENLPSGVYIYSLRVNDFVQNQKMALLK